MTRKQRFELAVHVMRLINSAMLWAIVLSWAALMRMSN